MGEGNLVYVLLMIIDFFLLLLAVMRKVADVEPEEKEEEEEEIVVKERGLTDFENVDDLEAENAKLREQIEELNRKLHKKADKIAIINQHLSEEQKSRIEAEEKAAAERQEKEEIAKRAREAEEEKKRISEKYEAEKQAWNTAVNTISTRITDLSFGKIRTINYMYLDQLISVHGRTRPIAVYVPAKSSELSHSGAFIYDTHKCEDNSLYLFVGKDCPAALEALGEKLLSAYSNEYPSASVFHVKRTTNGYEFNKMIKTIGGHIDQIQASVKAGDELFFENNFFKVKLHIVVFEDGKTSTIECASGKLSVDVLPKKGGAIVDCSDTALYLYMSSVLPADPIEKADQDAAVKYMSESPEYSNRDVTIFNTNCIPPNLKLLFGTDIKAE